MQTRCTHAGGVRLTACVDVGLTVSERYSAVSVDHRPMSPVAGGSTTVGYIAHLMGAAAGLAAGFIVLRPPSTPADRDRRLLRRRRRRTFHVIWSPVIDVSAACLS